MMRFLLGPELFWLLLYTAAAFRSLVGTLCGEKLAIASCLDFWAVRWPSCP